RTTLGNHAAHPMIPIVRIAIQAPRVAPCGLREAFDVTGARDELHGSRLRQFYRGMPQRPVEILALPNPGGEPVPSSVPAHLDGGNCSFTRPSQAVDRG